jgi:predicted dehydrogenase
MVNIGLVGIGFMGWIHYLAAQKVQGAKVAAICTRDPKKLAGDWRGIRGNFGPPGEQVDVSGLKRYEKFEDLLADRDIDLIDVCTPTHLHEPMALAALKAGKHVLVEKAIALDVAAADRMIQAATQAKRLLMVAHVLPFIPEFAAAAQMIKSGAHGRLLGGHFRRIISRPDWSADIGDAAKTGGPAVDLHIHDTHFIRLIAGSPRQVFSSGLLQPDGSVSYLTTNYLYGPSGPAISCSSGAVAMKSREFTHGFEIYLEKATLTYELGSLPLTLLPVEGKPKPVELKAAGELSAFTDEIQTAVDAAGTGKEPELLSAALARDALALCFKECASVASGKPV